MLKLKLCLTVVLPLLFTACAGPKPAAQRIGQVEAEISGVRSRAAIADQALDAERKAVQPLALPLPPPSTGTITAP